MQMNALVQDLSILFHGCLDPTLHCNREVRAIWPWVCVHHKFYYVVVRYICKSSAAQRRPLHAASVWHHEYLQGDAYNAPRSSMPAIMQLLQSSILQYNIDMHHPPQKNIPYIPFSPRRCPLLDALASSPDLSHVDLLSSLPFTAAINLTMFGVYLRLFVVCKSKFAFQCIFYSHTIYINCNFNARFACMYGRVV